MRTECLNHKYVHDEPLPIARLITNIGNKMQVCTQRYDRRPYGVGLLVAGYDVRNFDKYYTTEFFIIFLCLIKIFLRNLYWAPEQIARHIWFAFLFQDHGPHIYQTCPSANYFDCKAMAIGSRSQSARTYLEKHLDEFQTCDMHELVKHGLRALRDTLPNEVELNSKVISEWDLPFWT